jgi:Mg-chelatase subunit ChlD
MTPELPPNPRAELEAKITALLLGELPAEEAARVREVIAKDAELTQLQERLRVTLGLLRETIAETPVTTTPLKLSSERREKLLAQFKTIAPQEFVPRSKRKIWWLVPLAIAASVALLLAILIPNFTRAHTASQQEAIINNLRLLDSEKQQWALERHKSSTDVPTMKDLQPYGGRGRDGEMPSPVAGEVYELGPVSQSPVARMKNKSISLDGVVDDSQAKMEIASQQNRAVSTKDFGVISAQRPANAPTVIILPSNREPQFAFRKRDRNLGMVGSFGGGVSADTSISGVGGVPTRMTDALTARSVEEKNEQPGLAAATPAPVASPLSEGEDTRSQREPSFDPDEKKLSLAPGSLVSDLTYAEVSTVSGKSSGTTVAGGASALDQSKQSDAPLTNSVLPVPTPLPEILTRDNAFSTFSLNVGDVAFKLAAASLQNGLMPAAASMRSEEFLNAFDYRDPEPAAGVRVGFASERAADPFAQNRDLLRFSIKTAAQGREAGRPLNLVLLLDKSGSMERDDRVAIISEALRVLALQLQPQDTLSVVIFARTARLWVDGVPGNQAASIAKDLRNLTPEGGTDLEDAMKLAYATAVRHYLTNGENRVVLLTDGAANLGNVDPTALKQNVESNRKQGIQLDCFGIGWDGYNDNLLETLSRAGNGRYGFINTPEEAATDFAGKLAGALRVAAADVKVQVEFNVNRVTSYRQIGYAKDQLTKEQFRDNRVTAAQLGAAESGNALYAVEINPAGSGPVCTVHVRFRLPGTKDYEEHEWVVPYTGSAVSLDKASPAMRLAVVSSAFAEWLAGSPFAGEVTPDRLLNYLNGVPQAYGADPLPKKLEWMIRQAKSISGK